MYRGEKMGMFHEVLQEERNQNIVANLLKSSLTGCHDLSIYSDSFFECEPLNQSHSLSGHNRAHRKVDEFDSDQNPEKSQYT